MVQWVRCAAVTECLKGGAMTVSRKITTDEVMEIMKEVYVPEIPVNVVDLGLVYDVQVDDKNNIYVKMTLTAPGCPVAGEMPGWLADAVEPVDGVKTVNVEITWDPPWGMEMMSDEARLELGFMCVGQAFWIDFGNFKPFGLIFGFQAFWVDFSIIKLYSLMYDRRHFHRSRAER